MPRYFFNLWDHNAVVLDPDGIDLPDLSAATRQAEADGRAVVREGDDRGEDRRGWGYEIRDEQDKPVRKVPFSQL